MNNLYNSNPLSLNNEKNSLRVYDLHVDNSLDLTSGAIIKPIILDIQVEFFSASSILSESIILDGKLIINGFYTTIQFLDIIPNSIILSVSSGNLFFRIQNINEEYKPYEDQSIISCLNFSSDLDGSELSTIQAYIFEDNSLDNQFTVNLVKIDTHGGGSDLFLKSTNISFINKKYDQI